MDADARVLRQVRVAALVVGDGHLAGPRVIGDAVAGIVLVGTGGAVARDRAEHDARVDLAEPLVGQAALGQGARPHGLDDDVGVLRQIEIDLHAFRLAQVDGNRALAPVDMQGEKGVVPFARRRFDDRPGHLAPVVALGRLDLDHFGPQVREQARHLGRAQHRALHHSDTGEQGAIRHAGEPTGHP